MHKRHKYDIVVLLALIGFGVSLFLSIEHYSGFTVPCTITHGCETVLSSRYAEVFGLPLSVWGAGYFVAVVFMSLLANHYNKARRALTVLLGLGALGSAILLSIQFFVLKKVCQYCLTVDVINIFLFLWDLNVEYFRQENN